MRRKQELKERLPERNVKIIFQPYGKRGVFRSGTTILAAAKSLGIDLVALCDGRGTCGKCRIRVSESVGSASLPTGGERKHLSQLELESSVRLACQVHLTRPVNVFVPESSSIGGQRLQTEGIEVPVKVDPEVKKYLLSLKRPSLSDPRSDEDRLVGALELEFNMRNVFIEYEASRTLPQMLRKSDWRITVATWKGRIISVEPEDTRKSFFGFAVDIGTTKIAGFLVGLTDGKILARTSRLNPQIRFGEDVLTRISHVMKGGTSAQNELQEAVVCAVNEMVDECCEKAGAKSEEIYEFAFVGNTAMQMLFLKLWPQYVALSPFTPALRRGVDVKAAELRLKSHPRANAYFAPIIGGFVGADSVADLMTIGMVDSKRTVMSIDVGTNTEIALGNRDLALIVSCASGPAFEGMHIKHGMRAASGAIDRLSIDPTSLNPTYTTIEGKPPVGLCGSGLIDALSAFLKTGIIDMTGLFVREKANETRRLRRTREGWFEYVVALKKDTGCGSDISVTQQDIRELQKAKAAMRAGAEILIRKMKAVKEDVDTLCVAGAFGNYIDPESARTIGMFPEISLEKIRFVGNTAGTGARLCLISKAMRKYADRISRTVRHYELATDASFQKEYLDAVLLPHKDLSRQPIVAEMLRRLHENSQLSPQRAH